MDYYNGYLLDDCYSFDLTVRQKEFLDACIWLVDNKHSIRTTSLNFSIPKTSLHRWIHKDLRKLSYELYNVVNKVLKFNAEHHTNKRM